MNSSQQQRSTLQFCLHMRQQIPPIVFFFQFVVVFTYAQAHCNRRRCVCVFRRPVCMWMGRHAQTAKKNFIKLVALLAIGDQYTIADRTWKIVLLKQYLFMCNLNCVGFGNIVSALWCSLPRRRVIYSTEIFHFFVKWNSFDSFVSHIIHNNHQLLIDWSIDF